MPMRVVLSGGPGSGKTTTLRQLEHQGFRTVPESARAIMSGRRRQGLKPRPDADAFAAEIAAADRRRYREVEHWEGSVFFDRSLIDALLMLRECGRLDAEMKRDQLARYRYHSQVFLFPPWRAIYRNDEERDQNFDEAVRVYESLRGWYLDCGYNVIDVPLSNLEERCHFILRYVAHQTED